MSAVTKKLYLLSLTPTMLLCSCAGAVSSQSSPFAGTVSDTSIVSDTGAVSDTSIVSETRTSDLQSGEKTFQAKMNDDILLPFEVSDLDPAAYFANHYKEFSPVEIQRESGTKGEDVDPLMDFEDSISISFSISSLPSSYEVTAYRLYEDATLTPKEIKSDLQIGYNEGEATIKTTCKHTYNHHRSMYLYQLSDGNVSYYLGVYEGGYYLDASRLTELKMEASQIETIDFSYEHFLLSEETTLTKEMTFTSDSIKEGFVSSFDDPDIIVTDRSMLFNPVDGYRKADIAINKTDGSEVSFTFYAEVCRFMYEGESYYFGGALASWFDELAELTGI